MYLGLAFLYSMLVSNNLKKKRKKSKKYTSKTIKNTPQSTLAKQKRHSWTYGSNIRVIKLICNQ